MITCIFCDQPIGLHAAIPVSDGGMAHVACTVQIAARVQKAMLLDAAVTFVAVIGLPISAWLRAPEVLPIALVAAVMQHVLLNHHWWRLLLRYRARFFVRYKGKQL